MTRLMARSENENGFLDSRLGIKVSKKDPKRLFNASRCVLLCGFLVSFIITLLNFLSEGPHPKLGGLWDGQAMPSIGAIGSYRGPGMDRSMDLAAKIREQREARGGKSEAEIHLEKAKEQAKADNPEESLHMRITREANENQDKSLHLKLTKELNEKPAHLNANNIHMQITKEQADPNKQKVDGLSVKQSDPAAQGTAVDGLSAQDMGNAVAERTLANSLRSTANRFDPTSFENQGMEGLRRQRDVESYDPNGQAVRASSQQAGALLDVIA